MRYIVEHLTGTCYDYTYPEDTYSASYVCDICYDKHNRQGAKKDIVFEVAVGDHRICSFCRIERNREKVDNYFKQNFPKVEGKKGMVKRWYPAK